MALQCRNTDSGCSSQVCRSISDAESRYAAGDDESAGVAGDHADTAGYTNTADGVAQPRSRVSLLHSLGHFLITADRAFKWLFDHSWHIRFNL